MATWEGHSEEDILISGSTDFDENHLAALCAIMDEWTRTDNSFENRVNNVYDGSGDSGALNAGHMLIDRVTISDGDRDEVSGGGSDLDWLVVSESDNDKSDKLKDGEAFWTDFDAIFFED